MSTLSLLGDEIAAGLTEMESLTGSQTFTWKGVEVVCVPSSLRVGQTIGVGGHEEEITLTLFVRRAHFVTADSTLITVDSNLYTMDSHMPTPVAGRTLAFRGVTYRILAAREPAARAHLELDLGDAAT